MMELANIYKVSGRKADALAIVNRVIALRRDVSSNSNNGNNPETTIVIAAVAAAVAIRTPWIQIRIRIHNNPTRMLTPWPSFPTSPRHDGLNGVGWAP